MATASAPEPELKSAPDKAGGALAVAAVELHAHIAGVLVWPDEGLLAVPPLPLEKC